MSGTRKMETLEVDSSSEVRTEGDAPLNEDQDKAARSSRSEQVAKEVKEAKEAAAAIADLEPAAVLDALMQASDDVRPGADAQQPVEARPEPEKEKAEEVAAEPTATAAATVTSQESEPRTLVPLADAVTEAFRDFAIGAGAWAVELSVPQDASTGRQDFQHLRLCPRRAGYTMLVGGTINQIERRAELRDFDHVAILHEVRFRHSLEIENKEWEQFLRKAEAVLNGAGIQSMRTPPPRDLLEQRRNMQRISKGAVVALVVVTSLAVVVLWRVAVVLTTSP